MGQLQELEAKIARQKRELEKLNSILATRGRQLDAMAWVWCDGGCPGGVFRWVPEELTEEVVRHAEINTDRLRRALSNHTFKKRWAGMSESDRSKWLEGQRSHGCKF